MRYDVKFTTNGGTPYGFMLAEKDGRKDWSCKRIKTIAPSLVKYRIEMTLAAVEKQPNRLGVTPYKKIDTFISDLETIAAETSALTLVGLDERSYSVLVDETGVQFDNTVEEGMNRNPEYQVKLVCWGLWT